MRVHDWMDCRRSCVVYWFRSTGSVQPFLLYKIAWMIQVSRWDPGNIAGNGFWLRETAFHIVADLCCTMPELLQALHVLALGLLNTSWFTVYTNPAKQRRTTCQQTGRSAAPATASEPQAWRASLKQNDLHRSHCIPIIDNRYHVTGCHASSIGNHNGSLPIVGHVVEHL